jgi:hypothetical protein
MTGPTFHTGPVADALQACFMPQAKVAGTLLIRPRCRTSKNSLRLVCRRLNVFQHEISRSRQVDFLTIGAHYEAPLFAEMGK